MEQNPTKISLSAAIAMLSLTAVTSNCKKREDTKATSVLGHAVCRIDPNSDVAKNSKKCTPEMSWKVGCYYEDCKPSEAGTCSDEGFVLKYDAKVPSENAFCVQAPVMEL